MRRQNALRSSTHSMAQSDMHVLFQQMGEVLTGIRALHDMMDVRQAQAEQLHGLVRADIATLRSDQRELEEKFECVVCIVQHEMEALRQSTAENARLVDDIASVVDKLRQPIADVLGLKARAAGLLFGLGLVGSAALWLAEPVYGWFISAGFGKR